MNPATRCFARVDDGSRDRSKHYEIRIPLQGDQTLPRTHEEQSIAEFEAHGAEFGPMRSAIAPDGDQLELIAAAEVQLTDRFTGEGRMWMQRGFHHLQCVRVEDIQMRRRIVLDAQLLKAAQHVDVFLSTLHDQQITPLHRSFGSRHDFEFAIAEYRKQAKVECIGQSGITHALAFELGFLRHVDHEHTTLHFIELRQVFAGDFRRGIEFGRIC